MSALRMLLERWPVVGFLAGLGALAALWLLLRLDLKRRERRLRGAAVQALALQSKAQAATKRASLARRTQRPGKAARRAARRGNAAISAVAIIVAVLFASTGFAALAQGPLWVALLAGGCACGALAVAVRP